MNNKNKNKKTKTRIRQNKKKSHDELRRGKNLNQILEFEIEEQMCKTTIQACGQKYGALKHTYNLHLVIHTWFD